MVISTDQTIFFFFVLSREKEYLRQSRKKRLTKLDTVWQTIIVSLAFWIKFSGPYDDRYRE